MSENRLTAARIDRVVNALPHLIGHAGDQTHQSAPEQESLEALLRDYFRLMEIAHFVRRGGIGAMLYRLETGKTKFSPTDYLDEAHERLLACYKDIYKPPGHTEGSLLEVLREVSADEEATVAAVLPRLDEILLSDRRRGTVIE